MPPILEPQPRQRRYSVRCQARLDTETNAKLEELVSALHRKRAAILRHVMQWGLAHTRGWRVDPSTPERPQLVHMLVAPELYQQVQDAAAAHGVSVAAWLRHALRQKTPEDFPASWRAGDTGPRSHESGYYHSRFMLRLDDATQRKLEALMHAFHRPAAEVIRQLVAQARPEEFPLSWHLAVEERRARGARRTP
jgi:predicted transcriptional regulator